MSLKFANVYHLSTRAYWITLKNWKKIRINFQSAVKFVWMPYLKLKFSMDSNLGRHAALIAARRMRRCAKLATDFLASLCTICFIRNDLDLVSWTQLLQVCKVSWPIFLFIWWDLMAKFKILIWSFCLQ